MIYLFDAMKGKYSVFADDGNQIGCNADRHKIEQRIELVGRNAVVHCKSLHELEAYATTREMRTGLGGVGTLGIQYGYGTREFLIGHMMVADNEVDTQRLGIGNLLNGFYSAIENDDKLNVG